MDPGRALQNKVLGKWPNGWTRDRRNTQRLAIAKTLSFLVWTCGHPLARVATEKLAIGKGGGVLKSRVFFSDKKGVEKNNNEGVNIIIRRCDSVSYY